MMAHKNHRGLTATGKVRAVLNCPCHVCAFYSGTDEQYEEILPFLAEGLGTGERAVSFVDPVERAERIERLRRHGVNVEAAERNGQLEVDTWEEAYLRGGCFDTAEMIGLIQETINTGLGRGFSRTRVWATMEWALSDAPGVEQLASYENRLNFILPLYQDAVVCAYDTTRFPASVLQDVARAHPYLLVGGEVQENPHYMPPEQLTPELESRRS